ncbi:MAG: FAD-dependent oxidoreductase [Kiritimatiellae bacterium]|nr:FAD-dependent oxidoreductase [Kiritimatiellia bacterium]
MKLDRRDFLRGISVTALSAGLAARVRAEGTTLVPPPEVPFSPDPPKPFQAGAKTHPGKLPIVTHEADLCVVGGGIGGLLTAISAARHGAKVALMQDRPVLGGNASSEIRMWICGAGTRVRNLQETGIMEEIALENMHRNPSRNWSLWDALLYEKARFEPNIDLILNCACHEVEMKGDRIASVTGFQLTTYQRHTVRAKIFADCSGDSILAPLSGADYRVGREAKSEFGEEFGLDKADRRTMGMSLLIQARETDHKCEFTPPSWAYSFPTDEAMHNKPHECLLKPNTNFYWIELGGEMDTIGDTEKIRDELLKIAFGVWDHMKNHGDHGADNWEMEWLGFLPGKRESRRYVGDYTLTQQDVENGGKRFEDTVAYGGWQIDNHLPGGFFMQGKGGAHLQKRRLSEPYAIPYRCLYSRNVENLMMAGRNISATHIGFSTTRVMGTIGVIGQACGTAAALALAKGVDPRGVYTDKNLLRELQRQLMDDDCFLPGFKREISPLSKEGKLTAEYGDPSALQNGIDRRIWGNDNGYFGKTNKAILYTFSEKKRIRGFRLVVDSDLDREHIDGHPDLLTIPMPLFRARGYGNTSFGFPRCLLKSFKIEALAADGTWKTVYETTNNHQRLIRKAIDVETTAIRLIPLSTWGSERLNNTYDSAVAHIFAFDVIG